MGGALSKISHYHPPVSDDVALHNQTAPSPCTVEDLKAWRKPPRFTPLQRAVHLLCFVIFGIPKVVLALLYGLLAGSLYVFLVYIWRFLGRPVVMQRWLQAIWSVVSRIFLFLIGIIRVRFVGQLDPEARFIIANHVSFFDGLLYIPFRPRFIGKREMLKVPVIGDASVVYDSIVVDRERSTGVSKVMIEAAQDRTKPAMMVFPEGASTNGDYMLRFHLSTFLTDLPIQVCLTRWCIRGMPRSLVNIAYTHHDLWSALVWFAVPWLEVEVRMYKVVSFKTAGLTDPRAFADSVSLDMANELGVRLVDLSSSAVLRKQE